LEIRRLTKNDTAIWKQIRLEALQNAPTGFGASFEEASTWADKNFEESLHNNAIFGAFIAGELVACAGFYHVSSLKSQHCGMIWGVYTRPNYRGKGVATHLIKHIIAYAKPHVIQLHLTCATNNLAALKLYQQQGFTIYGTLPRALKVGKQFLDEHLMLLTLE
jgi:RimJ/RimL family protein N-acetyltransferase